jgi:tetratricopeptide (TPR) repeat protein
MSLFRDLDYAYVNNALSDENVLSSFIQSYSPAFMSVSLNRTKFPDFIRNHEEFRLIFFDDVEALYVNANKFRDIADRYQLKDIDPFQFKNINYQSETKERLSLIFDEAMKIRGIHPGCGIINTIAANILLVNKEHGEALPYVDAFIRHYPDVGRGYALKADALFGLERFPEALQFYKTALERGLKTDVEQVYRSLYATYVRLEEYKKAYKVFSELINPFGGGANYRDIFQLGVSAAAAGKLREAVIFLKIAQMKVPPDDLEYIGKIRENLLLLAPERQDAPPS